MLDVTVDLVPNGQEDRRRRLARLHLVNIKDPIYEARLVDCQTQEVLAATTVRHKREDGLFIFLRRCFNALVK